MFAERGTVRSDGASGAQTRACVSVSQGVWDPGCAPPTPSPRATPAGLCGTPRSPEVTLPLGGDEVLRTSDLGLPGAGRAAPQGLSPTGSLGP